MRKALVALMVVVLTACIGEIPEPTDERELVYEFGYAVERLPLDGKCDCDSASRDDDCEYIFYSAIYACDQQEMDVPSLLNSGSSWIAEGSYNDYVQCGIAMPYEIWADGGEIAYKLYGRNFNAYAYLTTYTTGAVASDGSCSRGATNGNCMITGINFTSPYVWSTLLVELVYDSDEDDNGELFGLRVCHDYDNTD